LQLRFRRQGDEVTAEHVLADRFHGAPGIAHGGIVATLLDEVSCAAVWFPRQRSVVTGELHVRYRRPCPVEVPLQLAARIVAEDHPRYVVVDAEIRCAGQTVATSSGRFFFSAAIAP
jgi:acyl-coenzyme A thioesterase PaaI-like protein